MPTVNTLNKHIAPIAPTGARLDQRDYPVAANQTIKAGDLVILNSGSVEQALALNATAYGATIGANTVDILGVALADITMTGASETTTGRSTIPVAISTDFECRAVNASVLAGTAASHLANAANHVALSGVTIGSSYVPTRVTGATNSHWFYAMHTTGDGSGQLIVKDKAIGQQATDIFGVVRVGLRASGRDIDAP